jgi:hypothetical protein
MTIPAKIFNHYFNDIFCFLKMLKNWMADTDMPAHRASANLRAISRHPGNALWALRCRQSASDRLNLKNSQLTFGKVPRISGTGH